MDIILDMSDYCMGYYDYKNGIPPIPDPQQTQEDVDYIRGYNDAKWNLPCEEFVIGV